MQQIVNTLISELLKLDPPVKCESNWEAQECYLESKHYTITTNWSEDTLKYIRINDRIFNSKIKFHSVINIEKTVGRAMTEQRRKQNNELQSLNAVKDQASVKKLEALVEQLRGIK